MTEEKLLQIIASSPLFHEQSEEVLKSLASSCQIKKYAKGEQIFMENDKAMGFFIVASGLVKVFKVSYEGKEQILHILGQGEPFGEVAVFEGIDYPANAQAMEKTEAVFLPKNGFLNLLRTSPETGLKMFAVLSRRLRGFVRQIETLALKEVPARLATHVLLLSENQGASQRISLNINKTHLASLIGTVPETLSRAFARLSSEEILSIEGQEIVILDRKALEAVSKGEKKLG